MRAYRWMLVAGLCVVTACSEQRSPVSVAEESEVRPLGIDREARRAPMERLARRVALALADPEFRAYVRRSLKASPYVERKLPFSRFLSAEGSRAGAALARADGTTPAAVTADLTVAGGLEFYFPVPAHRTAWQGGEDLLVATEVEDHEAPVAFDTKGVRHVLDPRTPPRTPVLAVVPQETDFETPSALQGAVVVPCDTCETAGTGTGGGGLPHPADGPPSLRMTYFNVTKDFEGWLKGDPEYEIHVMAPVSQTDTTHYRTLYCIGEHGIRYWNNDNDSWSGDEVLMTPQELEAYHTAFPRNNYSVLAIEDDDTACEIRVDQDRLSALIRAVSQAYANYKAARDSLGLNSKTIDAARAAYTVIAAIANFFKTNDDMIGIAVANSITGFYSPNANWAWIGENANRYGFVKLELK